MAGNSYDVDPGQVPDTPYGRLLYAADPANYGLTMPRDDGVYGPAPKGRRRTPDGDRPGQKKETPDEPVQGDSLAPGGMPTSGFLQPELDGRADSHDPQLY